MNTLIHIHALTYTRTFVLRRTRAVLKQTPTHKQDPLKRTHHKLEWLFWLVGHMISIRGRQTDRQTEKWINRRTNCIADRHTGEYQNSVESMAKKTNR